MPPSGSSQLGVGDLDAVVLEEHAELGIPAGGSRACRVPVDHAIVVAVHTARDVGLRTDQLAVGVDFLDVAGERDVRLVAADLEAVGAVPVIGRERRHILGTRRPGVNDETEADDENDRDDQGEQRPALEANAPSLALLGEAGGLLGRRG